MPDCHVETYRDAQQDGRHRGVVILTATGKRLYRTWPYRSETKAQRRAERWMNQEYARLDQGGRFTP